MVAGPLLGGLNLRKVALLGAAVLAALALMLGNQTGAKADVWTYNPCGGPYGVCYGTWVSGAYTGGVMNNYFVGVWKYTDTSDGTWSWGVCLDLHGDAPDPNAPWNQVGSYARADYGQVQYILQFMWPNPGSNPYPGDACGPLNCGGGGAYGDDANYDASAIGLGVWRITNGFSWPTSCNGCNLAALQASYTYVANTSDAHNADSRVCYNHTGYITRPNDPDGFPTPADGSAYTTTAGNPYHINVYGKLVGDLLQCQGAGGTQMQGSMMYFEVWGGNTTVSWNGGALGSYAAAGPGTSGSNGEVGAGLTVTPGPVGQQVSATVRLTIADNPDGIVLRPQPGHAPNGLQPMGVSQARCQLGNWWTACGHNSYWQETRSYYFTTTDAKPCGRTVTEDLTRDGNIGNISQASVSPTVNGGDSIRTYWDMWNCGTYGNLTNPSIDAPFSGTGTTSGWGVDFNGATAGGGATISFPGGNPDVHATGPTLAAGQHFVVTVNSTVVASLPSGVTQPDYVGVAGTYASSQGTVSAPETLTNVWGVGLLDPVSAIASCGSAYGSVQVSWQAPFSGPVPSSYKVYDVTSGTRVLLGSTTGLSYQALNHPPGTAYRFNVTSVSSGVESPGGTVTVDTPGAAFASGSQPYGIAITPDGTKAYVANYNAHNVNVINLANNTISASIDLGAWGTSPQGIAITPNGAKAYVTTSLFVFVINVATNTLDSSIYMGTPSQGIAITPNGATAYVTSPTGNTVTPINISNNTVGTAISLAGGWMTGPHYVAITPNGAKAYVTTDGFVAVLNLANNTIDSGVLTTGTGGIAITPNGATAYVANTTANTVTPITISSGAVGTGVTLTGWQTGPQQIAITPNGATAYVTSSAFVSNINLATGVVTGVIAAGTGGIAITPNGATAYVAYSGGGTVTPITLASTTYTKTAAFDPSACWAITAPAVTALEACASGSVGAHVTWTKPATYGETITSYVVSANRGGLTWTIANVNSTPWIIIDQGGNVTTVPPPNTPSLDVQGLFNATQYTFKVVAQTQHLTSSSTSSNAITPSCGG